MAKTMSPMITRPRKNIMSYDIPKRFLEGRDLLRVRLLFHLEVNQESVGGPDAHAECHERRGQPLRHRAPSEAAHGREASGP